MIKASRRLASFAEHSVVRGPETTRSMSIRLLWIIVGCILAVSGDVVAQIDFTDNFERPDGPVDGWTVASGSWQIRDGATRSFTGSEAWLWAGDPPLTVDGDFALSLTLSFPRHPGDGVGRHGGIMFFATGATQRFGNSGYTLDWIDRAADYGFRLIRWDGGDIVILVNGTPSIAEPPSSWELSIVGDDITVVADGDVILQYTDDTYRDGHFGLWSYVQTEMVVDNVDLFSGDPVVRACFDASPLHGNAPLTVDFDAACTTGTEAIATFEWAFSDGATAAGQTVSHEFETPDSHTAELTVTTVNGNTSSASRTIDALDPNPPPPDLDMSMNPHLQRHGGRGDSTVVFNELMYHPATNEAELEWIELYNQMAVDMDLSNWFLGDGIFYEIPDGTVIPGRGFLVIARSPEALEANLGVVGALGPFTARLSNGGENLELFNSGGRRMDAMSYGDGNAWSVAADGSGLSLAKIAPHSASEPAANWTESVQIGGTPGEPNFSEARDTPTLAFNEYVMTDAKSYWVEIVNDGDAPVQLEGHTIAPGNLAHEFVFSNEVLDPGAYVVLTRDDLGFDVLPGGKVFLYSPGGLNVVTAVVFQSPHRGRYTDGDRPRWLFPDASTPGAANSFTFEEDIIINEVHYHPRLEAATDDVFEETTLLPFNSVWRYDQSGKDLGAAWRTKTFNDAAWPSGPATLYVESSHLPVEKRTELTLGPTTFYFRATFENPGEIEGHLSLRALVDDAAIFYLNGVEIHRINMPDGDVSAATFASRGVSNAKVGDPVSIPIDRVQPGTNLLAVEVHQVSSRSADVVLAAELNVNELVEKGHPIRELPESWVELYNRGDAPVDLTHWRIGKGINYTFGPGAVIGGGEYLVVAEDRVALAVKYPGLRILGDFSGRLSNRSDHIVLKDAVGNPVDSVEYFDDGRWPHFADAGGSSLELRSPTVDNSKGEAWAASDETDRMKWRKYSYREVAVPNFGPTQWKEFVVGLLDAGEVLIDDLSVIQTPDRSPKELLQNGDFESGDSAWRILGNHRHSQVITDPDNPGNRILHVVATGPQEHMHNHLETTLVNNQAAPDGREYEVSFRARWLTGSNQLNTRLYFNRIPQTTLLDVPTTAGTPGSKNSTYEDNIGPTFDRLRHVPVIPDDGDTVYVSVLAQDPDGVAQMTLWYSVAGRAWTSVGMVEGVAGLYVGAIPPQRSSRVVQFYVEAEDGLTAVSTFPAGGRDSRALYKVRDGQSRDGQLHNFRMIMTGDDAGFLHADTNVMSNERLGGTVVYREKEVFYDVGIRLKGSQRGRPGGSRVSFSARFNADELFRGVHRTVALDRSGGWGIGAGPTGQDEIVIKHLINQAGLPGMYDDIGWVIAPRTAQNGPALVMMAKYSSVFRRNQFPNDSDGSLYKVELIYHPTTTAGGHPEGLKRPQPDGVTGTDLRDLGDDKEPYRYNFILENNESRDDYSRFIELCKVMDLSGSAFESRIEDLLDVDLATRMYVCHSLCGINDSYWSGTNSHNATYYELPGQGRFVPLAWDNDVAYSLGTTHRLWGGPSLAKLYGFPKWQRLFYAHMKDILDNWYNRAYMRRWTLHYGELAQEQGNFNTVLNYITGRGGWVRRQWPASVRFQVTTNNGNDFSVDALSTAIDGKGPLEVRTILIAERQEPPTLAWTGRDTWRLSSIPLLTGENELTLLAFDFDDELVDSESITVTSTAIDTRFIRGDVNRDNRVDLSDAVSTLLSLFRGAPLICADAADTNDDEGLDVSDVIFLLDYLFRGGNSLPAPFPEQGPDETGDGSLDC